MTKIHLSSQSGTEPVGADYAFQNQVDSAIITPQTQEALMEQTMLLVKCYPRQGKWLVALNKDNWQRDNVEEILTPYSQATKYNPRWYKDWHAWALANFEIVQTLTARTEGEATRADTANIV